MGILSLLLGGALIAGILSDSGSSVKKASCGWSDDVGSSYVNSFNGTVGRVNSITEDCKQELKEIEKLKPVEYKSRADEINSVLEAFNAAGRGNI